MPGGWIAAIFAGVLLSAYATESIGIALIFGAFVMGMVMPRHAGLTEDVTGRIEDFVVILLLPLFFAYTGPAHRHRPARPARAVAADARPDRGRDRRQARRRLRSPPASSASSRSRPAVIGVLMNTRGLTELIVLNLALEQGVISEALFASLVLMALVTTFMAGPLLQPDRSEERVRRAGRGGVRGGADRTMASSRRSTIPERSILLAPAAPDRLRQLRRARRAARPLRAAARGDPRRAGRARRGRPPPAFAPACRRRTGCFARHREQVHQVRDELMAAGIAARAVAFISHRSGGRRDRDRRGASTSTCVLVDGRRPLLGDGRSARRGRGRPSRHALRRRGAGRARGPARRALG